MSRYLEDSPVYHIRPSCDLLCSGGLRCESGIKPSEERPWGCLVSGHLWVFSPSPSQNNSHAYRVGMRSNTCDSLDPLLELRKGSWIKGELLSSREKKDDDENKMQWCNCSWVLNVSIWREFLVSGTIFAASESNQIVDWTGSDTGWFMFTKNKFKPGESDCAYLSSMKWVRKMASEPDPCKAICRYNLLLCLLTHDLNITCSYCVIPPNIAADDHRDGCSLSSQATVNFAFSVTF